MAIASIVTVSANTDSKRAVVYISSTQTTIEENGTAADYQDGSHGLVVRRIIISDRLINYFSKENVCYA
jgi:hypothetical protein